MRYLVVDVANVVKAGLYNGRDEEHGYKVVHPETEKEVYVNGAEYGFDSAVRFIKARLEEFNFSPTQIILVCEGPNSNVLRKSISDTYKAGRSSRYAPEQHKECDKATKMFVDQFLAIGAIAVTQPGLEADDMIAYLAQVLPSCLIVSTDGDMQQCISDKAHLYYDHEIDKQRYCGGVFPTKYTTLYKALVGDKTDKIKGAHGFGEGAFLDLFCTWGESGLVEMTRLIEQGKLEELVEDVPHLKSLQRIIDDREGVYLSWKLAKMYPEKVNTWRAPLQWTPGMVKPATKDTHPDLRDYCARAKIVHRDNFDRTLEWLKDTMPAVMKVSLDLETSGSDQSDEWLERKKKKKNDEDNDDLGVDVFGATITGMGLTLGDNDQFSLYFTVDHVEEPDVKNISKAQLAEVINSFPPNMPVVVHSSSFELAVTARELAGLLPVDRNYGFLDNVYDTRIMQSYVDETQDQGLKEMSERSLRYTQVTYEEVTKGRRMNQMTARETLAYGTDDTVCTAAHFNFLRLLIEIEGTWKTMLEVEQDAGYMGALAFNQGVKVSLERMLELQREDEEAFEKGWTVLRQFLIDNGWSGTVLPQAATPADVTGSFIKDAYAIMWDIPREKKERDEINLTSDFLDTRTRTPDKLAKMLRGYGSEPDTLLAAAIEAALAGDVSLLNGLIKAHFKGEPDFNLGSPDQCCHLMYEVMKLPIRIRNKPTQKMRAQGIKVGNPKADDYAMQWAVQDDLKPGDPRFDAMKALQAMKIADTRRKLYYAPYKNFPHWRDGLVHSTLTQCGPVTRRYSSAGPNLQQLPKHPKATGIKPKFREVIVPHHKDAVIVSMDFSGQELRIIADYSQDQNLLDCYVGDNLKDMHALTASAILQKKALKNRMDQIWTMAGQEGSWTDEFAALVARWKGVEYDEFKAMDAKGGMWEGLYKNLRALGKKTNFTTEYGAQKAKLSQTLLVPEEEAQEYLEARQQKFPRAEEWKREVIAEMLELGYSTTMMGARRHFGAVLASGNRYDIGAAERQAVNFKIQGSAAEQTKLAMGRFWRAGLCFKYDAKFIGPIHDEVVFSVAVKDLIAFLREAHAMMVAPYGGMEVPIISSISIGPNFGEQFECGESVDEAIINQMLAKFYVPKQRKEMEMA